METRGVLAQLAKIVNMGIALTMSAQAVQKEPRATETVIAKMASVPQMILVPVQGAVPARAKSEPRAMVMATALTARATIAIQIPTNVQAEEWVTLAAAIRIAPPDIAIQR